MSDSDKPRPENLLEIFLDFVINLDRTPEIFTVVVQNGDATLTQTPVYLIGQGDAAFQVVCPGRLSGTYRVNWTAEGGA